MAWRIFVVISLVLILAGASAFLVEGGFVPWIVPFVVLAVGFVLGGVVVRRTRGTQPVLAQPERRVKYRTRDLATHPAPGPKTEMPDREG